MPFKQLGHAAGFRHVGQKQNFATFGLQRSSENVHPTAVFQLEITVNPLTRPKLALHDVSPAAGEQRVL